MARVIISVIVVAVVSIVVIGTVILTVITFSICIISIIIIIIIIVIIIIIIIIIISLMFITLVASSSSSSSVSGYDAVQLEPHRDANGDDNHHRNQALALVPNTFIGIASQSIRPLISSVKTAPDLCIRMPCLSVCTYANLALNS